MLIPVFRSFVNGSDESVWDNMDEKSVFSHPTSILQITEGPFKYCPSLIEVDCFHVTWSDNIQTRKVLCASKYVYIRLKNCVFMRAEFVLRFITGSLIDRGARGGVVVKALRYKPAGCGFDSRWCHWNFSLT